MTHVFVSYSRADKALVDLLVDRLQSAGHLVWLDTKSLRGGADWEAVVDQAVIEAGACLVVLTPDAARSVQVRREVRLALDHGRPVIPIRFRGGDEDRDLADLGLEHLQCIDFASAGTWPAMEALGAALADHKGVEDRYRGLRALIIEDVFLHSQAMESIVAELGMESVAARTFDDALSQIREGRFQLILLDMQLDPLDSDAQQGRLLLDQARVHQVAAPVLIITGLDWTGLQVRDFLLRYRAHDFIQKPFDPVQLKRAIQKALAPR